MSKRRVTAATHRTHSKKKTLMVNGDGERGEVHGVGRSSDAKEIQQHLDREEKLRWWSATATSPYYWYGRRQQHSNTEMMKMIERDRMVLLITTKRREDAIEDDDQSRRDRGKW